jgi:hypothetical protein
MSPELKAHRAALGKKGAKARRQKYGKGIYVEMARELGKNDLQSYPQASVRKESKPGSARYIVRIEAERESYPRPQDRLPGRDGRWILRATGSEGSEAADWKMRRKLLELSLASEAQELHLPRIQVSSRTAGCDKTCPKRTFLCAAQYALGKRNCQVKRIFLRAEF